MLSEHVSLNTHFRAVGVITVGAHVLLWNRLLMMFRLVRLLLIIDRKLHPDVLTRFTLSAVYQISVVLMLLRLFPIWKIKIKIGINS
jgi:hypothetical protein